jgi:hypothetical protein
MGGNMRRAIATSCLMVASFTPFWWHQEPPKSASPPQNPPAATRPQSNPVPDKFFNLTVLPKDITKPKLVNVMRQFCVTFAVRCSYCHAVSDDLTEGSFESDDKESKVKARALIKAITDLNLQNSEH